MRRDRTGLDVILRSLICCGLCLMAVRLGAAEPEVPKAMVAGRVVDASGQPAGDLVVEVRTFRERLTGSTAADGTFAVEVPTEQLRGAVVLARSAESDLLGFAQLPYEVDASHESVELTLEPSQRVTIRVADGNNEPIDGARAGVIGNYHSWDDRLTDSDGMAVLAVPQDVTLSAVYAWKPGAGFDYHNFFDEQKVRPDDPPEPPDLSQPQRLELSKPITVDVKVVDAQSGDPLADVPVYPWFLRKPDEPGDFNLSFLTNQVIVKTDGDGIARFDWLPAWNTRQTQVFWPNSREHVHARGEYQPANVGGELTISLDRYVPISGQVRTPDGEPAAGISIAAIGRGHMTDDFRGLAQTDAQGRYRVEAAPNMVYLLVVADNTTWAAAPQTGFALLPGEPRENVDFDLRPATRLFGRVTVGPEEKPVEGQSIQSFQSGAALQRLEGVELPNPENKSYWVQPHFVRSTNTDEVGRYELFVGPGEYDIRGPRQLPVEKFTITDETEREFNFHFPREERGRLTGQIVAGDPPQPVPHAKVTGIYRASLAGRDLDITTDEEGRFDVERELHRTVMHATSSDGSQAGVVEIGPDDKDVTISIGPLASATGRVIDVEADQPAVEREITWGLKVPEGDDNSPFRTAFGGKTTTDADGEFRIDGLVVGQPYPISATIEANRSWRTLRVHTPEAADEAELGDLRLEPAYRPPTHQERIAKTFAGSETPVAERYQAVLRDAGLGRLQVLLIFADPLSPATEEFYVSQYEDRDVRSALFDYRTLALPTSGERSDETLALAADLGITFDGDKEQPRLVVLSAAGDPLANVTLADFRVDDALSKEELIAFFEHYRHPPLDARQLLDEALAQAKAENKLVFVQETASWCGPCWLLTRFLDDHHETFAKDYLLVKVDHRWTHAGDVMDGIKEGDRGGIPWVAILDADGKVLADSEGPDGNIGYPAAGEPAGIAHFISMLRDTAIRLSDDEIDELKTELESR